MADRAAPRRWGGSHAHWSLMPPEVMCLVFNHLPDKDRCNARLACKSWNTVFHMPQLWRERSFKFRGFDEEGLRAAHYMQTLGTHLRQMEIEIGMPVVQNARIISLSVETFLNAKARGMRLKSLACSGLEFFQTPLYRIARHRVRMVRALCSFLRHQRWLERVNLSCCQMGREDGARVLKALTFHCRRRLDRPGKSCLHNVELGDFFMDEVNVVEFPTFMEEMEKFTALRHLGLNFTYLSDAVLLCITRSAKNLESLALSMDGSQLILIAHLADNNLMVSTAGWRAASYNCPRLRVLVDVRGRLRLMDFQRLLLPCMPLGALSITSLVASLFFGADDMMAHIASLMDYLTHQFFRTLSAFHLGWFDSGSTWQDEEAVVKLVQSCPSLRYLSLALTVPLHTVLQVAKASRHGSVWLQSVSAWLTAKLPKLRLALPKKPLTAGNELLVHATCLSNLLPRENGTRRQMRRTYHIVHRPLQLFPDSIKIRKQLRNGR
ncbi:F-box only protein 39-like [Babylonia areolata]|uniref:F-box only protein 39-like n=1 Tax=Babylonia areolata TaxID=304850 RepID=UPI003FD0F26E